MERTEINQISYWVEKIMPQLLEDLKRICRIRSVAETENTGSMPYGEGCQQVLHEMLSMGSEYGFEIHNYEDYVGRITYQSKEKAIGIWSHLDVVEEGSGWQYAPYDPIVKDGYFIARGSQDNKSSAVMGLYVLIYMKEHQIKLNHSLQLYLGTCEEKGMHDVEYYVSRYQCPELSLVPDSGFPVCCGERGSFNGELTSINPLKDDIIEIFCDCGIYSVPDKAYVIIKASDERRRECLQLTKEFHVEISEATIRITSKGKAAHAANPEEGINALSQLVIMLCRHKLISEENRKILSLCNHINNDHKGIALNVSVSDEISGSITLVVTQARMADGRLVLGFMSKYPVTKNEFPYQKVVEEEAAKRGFLLRTTRYSPANYFNPEHPVVKELTGIYNEISGMHTVPFVMSGGTYAGKLPNAFAFGTGMPLPKPKEGLFLPGHGDYHQPDEAINIERIHKALIIYICSILRADQLESLHD